MSWTTAKTELRKLLGDGSTDKRTILKQCIGLSNGSNKAFVTFEARRLTNFTTVGLAFPLGVYIDGVAVPVTADDPESGVFELTTAPAINKRVEASYFSQWFLDTDLDQYLLNAAKFCRVDTAAQIGTGLQHAALKYAASEGYQYLSLFYARQTSEAFKLNDTPEKDRFSVIKSYADMSKSFRSEATTLRDDFYSRSGQQKSPGWGFTRPR